MTQIEKRFQDLRNNPRDCRYDTLVRILQAHGGREVNRRGAVRVWKLHGRRFSVSIHDGSVDVDDVRDCVDRILEYRDAVTAQQLGGSDEDTQ